MRYKIAGVAIIIGVLNAGVYISSAEMYKWVDRNGVVHFQDSPPSNIDKSISVEKLKKYDSPLSTSGSDKIPSQKSVHPVGLPTSKDKQNNPSKNIEWDNSFGTILEINENQFISIVKHSKVPVLFEVYATWCPRCTEFKPILAEVAKSLEGKVRVIIADGEKCPNLEKELGVQGYPTVFLFKNGSIIDKWAGSYTDKDTVIARINKNL